VSSTLHSIENRAVFFRTDLISEEPNGRSLLDILSSGHPAGQLSYRRAHSKTASTDYNITVYILFSQSKAALASVKQLFRRAKKQKWKRIRAIKNEMD